MPKGMTNVWQGEPSLDQAKGNHYERHYRTEKH